MSPRCGYGLVTDRTLQDLDKLRKLDLVCEGDLEPSLPDPDSAARQALPRCSRTIGEDGVDRRARRSPRRC